MGHIIDSVRPRLRYAKSNVCAHYCMYDHESREIQLKGRNHPRVKGSIKPCVCFCVRVCVRVCVCVRARACVFFEMRVHGQYAWSSQRNIYEGKIVLITWYMRYLTTTIW